jgi:TldD protein
LAQGYEAIEGLNFEREALRLGKELRELQKCAEVPAGNSDLILRGSILALQIHETFGHASESDRVYGYEDNYGGRTFLNPGLLGGSPVASSCVTLVSHAGLGQGWGAGSFAYDDEGVPEKRMEVVRKGVFTGYQTSRETAFFLNRPDSTANMVAQDWSHYPLIRMTNLSLLPGQGTLQEMITGTEKGFLLDNELSWSIDQMRLDFQIGAEAGYKIEKGKIQGLVRFPIYHGNTLDFWRSCDQIAGRGEWRVWVFSDCGTQRMEFLGIFRLRKRRTVSRGLYRSRSESGPFP